MQAGLQIRKGGKLVDTYWHYDEVTEHGEYKEKDVTEQAIRKIWDACDLAADVTLRDVFLLLQTELKIFDALLGNWCEELVTEGLTKPASPVPDKQIEYLEIYWTLTKDKDRYSEPVDPNKLTLNGNLFPNFHGMGFIHAEDQWSDGEPEKGWLEARKGERTPWGVSFTGANELIDIPLRLGEMVICDESEYEPGKNKMPPNVVISHPDYSLGHILYSIVWELSFHGGPETREAHKKDLFETVDKVMSGEAETVPYKIEPKE